MWSDNRDCRFLQRGDPSFKLHFPSEGRICQKNGRKDEIWWVLFRPIQPILPLGPKILLKSGSKKGPVRFDPLPNNGRQPSGENRLDNFAVHVGQSHVAAAESVCQTRVVDT